MTGVGSRPPQNQQLRQHDLGSAAEHQRGGTWAWGFLRRLPQSLKDVYSLKGEGEEDMGDQGSREVHKDRKEKACSTPREEALARGAQGASP